MPATNVLLIDNFDSFTYNLVDYLEQLGGKCTVIRNNVALETIMTEEYEGIVLSPGPETPTRAGNLMKIVANYQAKIPMLGVCLGHQAIGEFFGAKLVKAFRPMHGKLSILKTFPDKLWEGIPDSFQVVRYHSLVLAHLPADLKILATTSDGEIMAIRHVSLPIWGVQFHPEAVLTEYGLTMLQNWLAVCKLSTAT